MPITPGGGISHHSLIGTDLNNCRSWPGPGVQLGLSAGFRDETNEAPTGPVCPEPQGRSVAEPGLLNPSRHKRPNQRGKVSLSFGLSLPSCERGVTQSIPSPQNVEKKKQYHFCGALTTG